MGILDYNQLKDGFVKIKIGELSNDIIDRFNLNRNVCDIILWEDRFKYLEKHKNDFKSEEDFIKHIEEIPNIIANPDYVAIHPTKNSIEYIKRIDELIIVAVRLKNSGNIALRTAFILSEQQLDNYISCGTANKI